MPSYFSSATQPDRSIGASTSVASIGATRNGKRAAASGRAGTRTGWWIGGRGLLELPGARAGGAGDPRHRASRDDRERPRQREVFGGRGGVSVFDQEPPAVAGADEHPRSLE